MRDAGLGCRYAMQNCRCVGCRLFRFHTCHVRDAGVGYWCGMQMCEMQIVQIQHVSCAGCRSAIAPHNVSSSIFLTSSEDH